MGKTTINGNFQWQTVSLPEGITTHLEPCLKITTEAMVAEAPKKDNGAAPAMPDMGGMGGMGGMM